MESNINKSFKRLLILVESYEDFKYITTATNDSYWLEDIKNFDDDKIDEGYDHLKYLTQYPLVYFYDKTTEDYDLYSRDMVGDEIKAFLAEFYDKLSKELDYEKITVTELKERKEYFI